MFLCDSRNLESILVRKEELQLFVGFVGLDLFFLLALEIGPWQSVTVNNIAKFREFRVDCCIFHANRLINFRILLKLRIGVSHKALRVFPLPLTLDLLLIPFLATLGNSFAHLINLLRDKLHDLHGGNLGHLPEAVKNLFHDRRTVKV